MFVGEICNRHTAIIGKSDSIYSVAMLMREHQVSYIVVVEPDHGNNVPIGAITDRDIVVEMIANRMNLDSVVVGEVMNTQIMLANEHDDVMMTLKRMRHNKVRCMPIVNADRALVGTLSIDNILDTLSELLNDIDYILKWQQLLANEISYGQH